MKKLFLPLLLFIIACNFPKDPEDSYSEAREDKLLVGVVDNPPFCEVSGENFSGSEVELLRKFAGEKDLEIEFHKGSETELIKKLEKFELHLVAGGFEKKTVWKKKAGRTTPYDNKHVFLIPKGENELLKHLESFIFQQKKKS
ncbi:transporter substrate-binding domain-containing protein [Salinimicrobium flavum]|uniref:Transporter substrate-binding domain-containing protein n=1 Tax=Salinimicrobium flavum TaxID=1737065 RepID=A0ABW5IRP6_9FLAO